MESVLIPSVRVPMETQPEPPPRHILKIALDQRGEMGGVNEPFSVASCSANTSFPDTPTVSSSRSFHE